MTFPPSTTTQPKHGQVSCPLGGAIFLLGYGCWRRSLTNRPPSCLHLCVHACHCAEEERAAKQEIAELPDRPDMRADVQNPNEEPVSI